MSETPVAYTCEVYVPSDDEWMKHITRTHPSETFDELEYRYVTPLLPPRDSTPRSRLKAIESEALNEESPLELSDLLTVVSNHKSREWINDVITDGEESE